MKTVPQLNADEEFVVHSITRREVAAGLNEMLGRPEFLQGDVRLTKQHIHRLVKVIAQAETKARCSEDERVEIVEAWQNLLNEVAPDDPE